MRQNKICCKWQSKEIWRMTTYIRPWVIVKSLGQRISYCLSDHLRKNLICSNKLLAPSCQERWSISLASFGFSALTRSRVVPHFIIRTFTNKNCLKNPSTENRHREIFPLPFSFFNAFLSFLEFRARMKLCKNSKPFLSWLLLSCPATTLTNYVFGSLFVLFFVFYVLFLFSFHHPRTTLICTWSLSMFPVVRCFHICEKLDDSGKCLSPQFAINPVWKPAKHVA